MELSYTFLKRQVMLPGKYFSPLVICTPPALELWKRQLKLFQESARSLVVKGSDISPLPPGWSLGECTGPKGNCSVWGRDCVLGSCTRRPSVLAALGTRRAVCKHPQCQMPWTSERMPVGLMGVNKQEQTFIQRCAACSSS